MNKPIRKTMVIAALLALALTIGVQIAQAGPDPDVPPAPVPEKADCNAWFPNCWKEKWDARSSSADVHAAADAERDAAYAEAVGQKKYVDDQLADLAAQVDRTTAHFEQLLSERDLAAEADRLYAEALEEQVKAWSDKDERLEYVEGCFIQTDKGQAADNGQATVP